MDGLGEAFEDFTPAELTALLTERGDLITPPPPDLAELARRATTAASVRRALDLLNRRESPKPSLPYPSPP
mgnify:CR=1 FL=1